MQKFFSDAVEFVPILLQGVWLTIVVTIGSMVPVAAQGGCAGRLPGGL